MANQISFTHLEKEIMPEFRDKIKVQEEIIDLKNCFSHSMSGLLRKIFESKMTIKETDIVFAPEIDCHFKFSTQLHNNPIFQETAKNSDLLHVIRRFAHPAFNRFLHLKKHSIKSELKIRK